MTQPSLWIGTSWKMNKTLVQAEQFAAALKDADPSRDARIQRFVIPSFTTAREVSNILKDTSVKVGAQNMHWADEGAWTGEVSPVMLKDCNLDIVELGHSERREHFGETNETVGLKTQAAVRHGLTPLICIGETLAERDAGRAREVLATQVRAALGALDTAQYDAPILFAYEPFGPSVNMAFRQLPTTQTRDMPKSSTWRMMSWGEKSRACMADPSIHTTAKTLFHVRTLTGFLSAGLHGM